MGASQTGISGLAVVNEGEARIQVGVVACQGAGLFLC